MPENNDKEVQFVEADSKFQQWFDNFWYHYKIQAVIALVAVITLIICFTQVATREKYDYHTLYCGPMTLAVQDATYIERAFAKLGDDLDGDGKVNVAFNDITLLSEEEIAAASEGGAYFNGDFIRQSKNEFYQHMISGDAYIYLLSPSNYASVRESNGFVPLSEILPDTPSAEYAEFAYDDCGIILSKTDFGQSFNGLNKLPDNTILCLRKNTSVKKMSDKAESDRRVEECKELIRRAVAYKKG